jgi:hypothetical protein
VFLHRGKTACSMSDFAEIGNQKTCIIFLRKKPAGMVSAFQLWNWIERLGVEE